MEGPETFAGESLFFMLLHFASVLPWSVLETLIYSGVPVRQSGAQGGGGVPLHLLQGILGHTSWLTPCIVSGQAQLFTFSPTFLHPELSGIHGGGGLVPFHPARLVKA